MRNSAIALVLFSSLAGALLTIWGLTHLQWPQALPWSDKSALIRYAGFLISSTALIFVGSWWSKKSALLVGAVVAVGFALLAGALWPLLITLWFAAASAILGRNILTTLRIKFEGDIWLTSFLVGAGVYGTVVGLLAHFPVNYPGVYGMALALPLILNWRVIVEQAKNLSALVAQRSLAGFSVDRLDVAIAVVALVHFVVALMPEVGFDALWQHMFVSAHLAARHQWGFDAATYVWAVIPLLGDWIFSIGYMLAGETAARLVNVGFIFVLGWLVRDLVLWAGGSAVGARWAALIFLSTPLTFTESSTLFIESVFASFVVAGALSAFRACSAEGNKNSQIIIAGLLLGCALATKAVTFLMLPALLLILIWRYKVWLQSGITGALALGLVLFFILGSMPYTNAWWLTGNPVFPFFNKVFQSPLWHPVNFEATAFGKGITWDVLYQVIFHSDKYLEARPGASGFQWLILFLPTVAIVLLSKQLRVMTLLFFGIASVIFVFYSTAYLRYIFPACVILIAAIGAAMGYGSERNVYVKRIFAFMGSVVILTNLAFLNAGAFYGDFPLRAILSEESRSQYLAQRLPIRNAVELVNRLNTGRSPVAIFSHPLAAGIFGDALYPDWTNFKFQGEIGAIQIEQDLVNILLKRGADFVILDSNWNGVNCCSGGAEKQALIEKVSEKVAEFGSLSVRKVKTDYRFKTELLNNSDFTSTNGWSLAVGAKHDVGTGVLLASVASNASQSVTVSSGRRYLNTVVARCFKEKTLGRIQVNWQDANGRFISTDIQTFECSSDWTEHSMEMPAPANASSAIIYAAGHTPTMIEFKSISFRQ